MIGLSARRDGASVVGTFRDPANMGEDPGAIGEAATGTGTSLVVTIVAFVRGEVAAIMAASSRCRNPTQLSYIAFGLRACLRRRNSGAGGFRFGEVGRGRSGSPGRTRFSRLRLAARGIPHYP